jgi:hypothetical protein
MTSENGHTVPPETPGAARYIALLAEELAQIILDMARLEAEQISGAGTARHQKVAARMVRARAG